MDQLAILFGSEMCFLRPWAPKAPRPTAVAPKTAPVFQMRVLIASCWGSVLFWSAVGRRGEVSSVAIQFPAAMIMVFPSIVYWAENKMKLKSK